jgi:hypothetical protein
VSRAWLLLLLGLLACGGSLCGESYLAELESHQGEVQRDQAHAVGAWASVSQGDRFRMGDGLRTGRSGTARLSLAADGVAQVEANTVLRFLDRDPRGAGRRIAVEDGVVRIESGQLDLDIDTPRALARLTKGSKVRIVAADRGLQLDVEVGRVAIDRDGGSSELLAGQKIELGLAQPVTPSEPIAPPAAAAAVVTPAAQPTLEQLPADVTLPALEPSTLHATSLPLALRLPAVSCDERLAVELNGRSQGDQDPRGPVARVANAGAHRLRLRCGKTLVSDLVLRVVRDAATLELPKSAQRVEVEADGRRYTVRYHNVLPVVSVRWRDAKPAPSYALVLERGGRERKLSGATASRELGRAELTEGDYKFWFTGAAGQRSPVGSLRIEFDNTARALSLSEPVDGSTAEGDQTMVSGMALLRSTVSANGVALALDAKGRFSSLVPLGEERSVLVRAIHPAAGVHYYLRRLR